MQMDLQFREEMHVWLYIYMAHPHEQDVPIYLYLVGVYSLVALLKFKFSVCTFVCFLGLAGDWFGSLFL